MAPTRAQLANPDCPVSDADYEAIEAAIMETERGRWFLHEYARRNRYADTRTLLSAIGRLESALTGDRPRAAGYIVNTQMSAVYSGQAATARQLRVVHAAAPLEIEHVAAVEAVAPPAAEAALPTQERAYSADRDSFVFKP